MLAAHASLTSTSRSSWAAMSAESPSARWRINTLTKSGGSAASRSRQSACSKPSTSCPLRSNARATATPVRRAVAIATAPTSSMRMPSPPRPCRHVRRRRRPVPRRPAPWQPPAASGPRRRRVRRSRTAARRSAGGRQPAGTAGADPSRQRSGGGVGGGVVVDQRPECRRHRCRAVVLEDVAAEHHATRAAVEQVAGEGEHGLSSPLDPPRAR